MFAFVKTPTLLVKTKIQYSCDRCPTSMSGEGHEFQFPVEDMQAFRDEGWRNQLWQELAATPRLCEPCIAREAAEKKRADNVAWVEPVSLNDWGVDFYYAVYDRTECMNGSTFSSQSCPYPPIKHGDRCEVKWPDGSVCMAMIREGNYRQMVIDDMGTDYHTSTSELFVEQYVNGAVSLVPLMGSGIMLRPAKRREAPSQGA